jgi:hypothetical protein
MEILTTSTICSALDSESCRIASQHCLGGFNHALLRKDV